MRIAFLTPEYPHLNTSKAAGIGTSIKNLATELTKSNHQIFIIVYSQDTTEIVCENGIVIHKIAHKKYKALGWYLYRKHIQNYVNKLIQTKKIDLIEAPDWTGITAFMKLKCKLVIRLHGSDAYFCALDGRKQKLKNFYFEKKALMGADAILSVSKFTALKTKELFQLKATIKVIYNGVDISLFRNTVSKPKPFSILYFGSIIRKKGVLELALIFNEVVKLQPLATLTLIGGDVNDVFEKKSTLALFLELLSAEGKARVNHFPHKPYNTIIEELEKASVVVLPSFAEAFPMTWLEAMAMKKAVVTSNIGWANELVVDGETGFMENPKNHKHYALKIIQLLENDHLNKSFGENAHKHIAANFSQEIICKKNINFFESILNS